MEYRIRIGRRAYSVHENLVDRIIRVFDPVRARARLGARFQFEALAGGYTGASRTKRSLSKWNPRAGSADADTLGDLPTLRSRSRDLVRNAPLAGGAINTVALNVVGTGLMPRARPDRTVLGWDEKRAAEWKRTVDREWALWAGSKNCDATRTQTFYGLQDLVFRSVLENGDAFAALQMLERSGATYALAVQLIEADRVSNKDNQPDSLSLAGGVALDDNGAPVKYHVQRAHPGDLTRGGKRQEWDVVDAFGAASGRRNVLHLYHRLRIGQTRGVPYLAPVIEAFKNLDRYSEAELFAAVANAMFALKTKSDGGAGLNPAESASTGETPQTGDAPKGEGWDGSLTPGLVVDLDENKDVTSFQAGRPNPEHDPFVNSILRQIGVRLGIPYEVLVLHFTSSYTAARGALLQAWKFFRTRRDWLADDFCRPVYEAWLAEAVARGRVEAPGFFADAGLRAAYCGATWHGDGPGSIDPLKEVLSARKRTEMNLRTLEAEIAEDSGGDVDAILEQRGREVARERELGIATAPTGELLLAPDAPEPIAPERKTK
jgi:lambda family phage portal protein